MDEEQLEVERERMQESSPAEGRSISHRSQRNSTGLVIGAVIIFVGLILLAGLLKLLPTGVFLPLPWVAVGLFLIGLFIIGQGGKSTVLGLLLLLVSAGYLARYSGVFDATGFHQIWLITVILVGLVIFIGSRKK